MMTFNFDLAGSELRLALCPTALKEAPFGHTGPDAREEFDGTRSCIRTDVAAILERNEGQISGVEDGIYATLRDRHGVPHQVELRPSDFEPGCLLKPGQTFEAQWVRLESGAELWRCQSEVEPGPPGKLHQ